MAPASPDPEPLPLQRHLFDIPDDVAYLNCAYMSPLPLRSLAAGRRALAQKAQPWSITASDFFTDSERARALFGSVAGVSAESVAIVPSVSYGMAVAAANVELGPGRDAVVLADEFPSNVYPWQAAAADTGARVRTVHRPEDGDWTGAVLDELDEHVGVVAVPHCHWTDGGLVDLVAVGERCRRTGAALVVDAVQSLGALPLDLGAVRPDFLVATGYKWLLGPYSIGFLYADPRHHGGRPVEHNWITRLGSEDFAGLVGYRDEFQPGARRFDVGERSNFALMPVMIASLEQLLEWGIDLVAASTARLTARIAEGAGSVGWTSLPPGRRAGHLLGLRRQDGAAPSDVAGLLAAARVYVSVRGTSIRVAPHVYNSDADADRLLEVLSQAARG